MVCGMRLIKSNDEHDKGTLYATDIKMDSMTTRAWMADGKLKFSENGGSRKKLDLNEEYWKCTISKKYNPQLWSSEGLTFIIFFWFDFYRKNS